MDKLLDAAYRATSYVVDAPEGRFTLRVGERSPPLDDLLARCGTCAWAFVTACNPGSQMLSPTENHRRQEKLLQAVAAAGHPCCPGQGKGDDGAWPAEASLLIIGIDPVAACTLGRRFGQKAILIGETGEAVRLLWV